jgi:hypothetical protein
MRRPIRIVVTAAAVISAGVGVADCASTPQDDSVTVPATTSTHSVRSHRTAPAVTNGHSAVVSVTLRYGGKTYRCPLGTGDKLQPYRMRMGEIELPLRHVRAQERAIARRYGHTLPAGPWARWTRLLRRERHLVHAYNVQADEHNAIIDSDCTT